MMRELGVDVLETDQCMFGLETWGSSRAQLVLAKKPTRFMTNSRSIGQELRRKCDGAHPHQPLVDGRANGCGPISAGIVPSDLQGHS